MKFHDSAIKLLAPLAVATALCACSATEPDGRPTDDTPRLEIAGTEAIPDNYGNFNLPTDASSSLSGVSVTLKMDSKDYSGVLWPDGSTGRDARLDLRMPAVVRMTMGKDFYRYYTVAACFSDAPVVYVDADFADGWKQDCRVAVTNAGGYADDVEHVAVKRAGAANTADYADETDGADGAGATPAYIIDFGNGNSEGRRKMLGLGTGRYWQLTPYDGTHRDHSAKVELVTAGQYRGAYSLSAVSSY